MGRMAEPWADRGLNQRRLTFDRRSLTRNKEYRLQCLQQWAHELRLAAGEGAVLPRLSRRFASTDISVLVCLTAPAFSSFRVASGLQAQPQELLCDSDDVAVLRAACEGAGLLNHQWQRVAMNVNQPTLPLLWHFVTLPCQEMSLQTLTTGTLQALWRRLVQIPKVDVSHALEDWVPAFPGPDSPPCQLEDLTLRDVTWKGLGSPHHDVVHALRQPVYTALFEALARVDTLQHLRLHYHCYNSNGDCIELLLRRRLAELRTLHVENEISAEGMALITGWLSDPLCVLLDLSLDVESEPAFLAFLRAVGNNTSLRSLRLGFGNDADFAALSAEFFACLVSNMHLERLVIDTQDFLDCRNWPCEPPPAAPPAGPPLELGLWGAEGGWNGNPCQTFGQLVSSRTRVTRLDLTKCSLERRCFKFLARSLAGSQLEALVLDDSNLPDRDARHFAIALERNATLKYLSVKNTSITRWGQSALVMAMRINTTLTQLDLDPITERLPTRRSGTSLMSFDATEASEVSSDGDSEQLAQPLSSAELQVKLASWTARNAQPLQVLQLQPALDSCTCRTLSGAIVLTLPRLPAETGQALHLRIEASFPDAPGRIQTLLPCGTLLSRVSGRLEL